MSYLFNLGCAIVGIDTFQSTRSQFIGGNRKYKANQQDKNLPIEEGYATSSDVFAITNKIANSAKSIDWKVELHKGDKIETVTDHELIELINKPNDFQTKEEYREQAILNRLLSGNTYMSNLVPVGFNTPSETTLLHPQLMDIDTTFIGPQNTVKQFIYKINGKDFKFTPEEITHLKYCNPTMFGINHLLGFAPLIAGYLTLIGLTKNDIASASIAENQAVSGILSNEGEYSLTGKEQEVQQELLNKKLQGASKFGSILQSMVKTKFTKIGLDPTQLKILETQLFKKRSLCNLYDTPSQLFNDPKNNTFNSIPAATSYFWRNPVLGNLNSFIAGYNESVTTLFNKKEFPKGNGKYIVSADTTKIEALQKDKKTEAEKDKLKMEGVNIVLAMPISDEGKVILLVDEYDYSEENARKIAATKPIV